MQKSYECELATHIGPESFMGRSQQLTLLAAAFAVALALVAMRLSKHVGQGEYENCWVTRIRPTRSPLAQLEFVARRIGQRRQGSGTGRRNR
jgi:hypothetical protein